MANPWIRISDSLPANNQIVYIRILTYFTGPVKAKFNLPLGQFTTSVTLVKIPTFMIAAWKIYP